MIMNNLANCFHNQKNIEKQLQYSKIKDSLQTKDDIYYKISSNLAKTLWYEEAKYNPTPVYLELKILCERKDDWGWMLPMPIYQNIIFTPTKTLQCFTLIRCMILQTN